MQHSIHQCRTHICFHFKQSLCFSCHGADVMYGCSGQHRSRVIWLAELFHSICQVRGAYPSCLHRLCHKSGVTHMWVSVLFIATYLSFREGSPEWGVQVFMYTWSWGEVAASEESRKESCVIKPSIEGLIGGGSITQHPSTPTKILFCPLKCEVWSECEYNSLYYEYE